jgi:protein-S-isoprenylcysteine O-methyltransferase Ste14
MSDDHLFRWILLGGMALVFPLALYHRLRAHTGEKLDRRQEGWFILLTLRPVGLLGMAGLLAFVIDPAWMAWSSVAFPAWLRWAGVGLGAVAAVLLIWTMHTLGKNLTDTVVTRRAATLVTAGPYRWVRHPFYVCVALAILANSLAAANSFILATGGIVVALLVRRTRKEEQNLIERFGDAYRGYMASTGRFLPRLRRDR